MDYTEIFESNPPGDLSFIQGLMQALGEENIDYRKWESIGRDARQCMRACFTYHPKDAAAVIFIHIDYDDERVSLWIEGEKMHIDVDGFMDSDYIAAMVKGLSRRRGKRHAGKRPEVL